MKLLTSIRLPYYSDGMIPDFHNLSEKITQLVALTQALRKENAALQLTTAALTAENADLSQRVSDAYLRVSALLQSIPETDQNQETA